jgi:hypothetical protein
MCIIASSIEVWVEEAKRAMIEVNDDLERMIQRLSEGVK